MVHTFALDMGRFLFAIILPVGQRNDYFHVIVIDNLNCKIPLLSEGTKMLINFLISYSFSMVAVSEIM